MIRIAQYMRVSTDRQAKEGDSIPAQREALQKYIDARQDAINAGVYIDDGISGTKNDRDELQRLLSDVRAGKIDMIIFTKLDRWYRSIRHYTATQEILDKCGVTWLAIWEPVYDTTTPAGRLIVNQMMSIAQFEAENTGQRIRRVFDYKTARGEVTSGKVPVGYKIREKHLVIDEETASDVAALFDQYAARGCLNDIIRFCEHLPGFPSSRSSIARLLKNRKYIGEYRGKPGFCPAIVPRKTFDRVQFLLSRNVRNPESGRVYLFTGLIRCGVCGGHFVAAPKKQRNGSITIVYRCRAHYDAPKGCTFGKIICENVIEKYLVDNLADLVGAFRIRLEEERGPALKTKKTAAALQARMDRLKRLYLDDIIDIAEYKADREALQRQIDAINPAPVLTERPVETFDAESGINLYKTLEKPERRLFWRSVLDYIVFNEDRSLSVFFL